MFSSLVLKAAVAKKEKEPIMSCASTRNINKLKQSLFVPSISMVVTFFHQLDVWSAKMSGGKGQGTLTKGESLVLLTSSLK